MRKCFSIMLRSTATVLCLIASMWTTPAWGQQNQGAITGRITDPSSGVIAGAAITLANQETGVKRNTTTNQTGNYGFASLPFGSYELEVQAKGFRKLVQQGIRIYVGQTTTLDLALELGSVDQTVEVIAAAPIVESSTSDLGTVVDAKQVQELPVAVAGNMRSPESFILLTPGVTGAAATPNINGSQQRSKEVLFDGVMSTGPESGGVMFTVPPVESVGEFKLLSANYSAEYGHSGGGFEVFSTKSGTNTFHGSLFEYFRNNDLDARGFISPTTPINRQNEFGATIGGPVRLPHYDGRNRTFFYFVYDGFRYAAGATNQLITLPTAAQRNGDFSGLTKGGGALQIYDPGSTRQDGSGGFTRDLFPNAQIPTSRFSKVAVSMLSMLPAAGSAAVNNYTSTGNATFNRDVYTFKIDHLISDRNRFNLFGYFNKEDSLDAAFIAGPWSPGLDQKRPDRWLRFNHDYSFNSTTMNSFRAGYTHAPQVWQRLTSNQGLLPKTGLKGVNPPDDVLPQIQFSDTYQNWGDQIKNTGEQVNNTLHFADTVTMVRGNHTWKFGADMRWQQTNGADHANQQGLFKFNSNETALPTAAGRANTGNPFASFLLGAVDSSTYNELFVVPGNRYRYKGLFVQDDWKVSRRLTLNLGLRWDYFSPREEHNTNISGFDPSLANPGAGNLPGAIRFLGNGQGRDNSRSSFADPDYKDFGPRFGFAYMMTQKTVIRGGYGLSYGMGNGTAGLRDSQNFIYGFNAAPSYASTDSGVTPAFNLDSGFPTNWPLPPFIDPTVQNGSSVRMIGKGDGRTPYFSNYQINVQRELSGQSSIEAAYVGVKGTRLGNSLINLNQVDPRYLSLGALLTQSVTSAAAVAAGIKVPYPGFTGSVAQALRPYPVYQAITNNSNPNGNSTYSALQVKYTKRMSHGMTALVAYTWSKTISDGDISAGGGPAGQDYYNRRLEKAIADYDVPQLLTFAYTYELPFGKGKKYLNNGSVAAHILGGWQLNGIQSYQTGTPVQLTVNNTLPIFNGTLRPNLVGGTPMTLDHPDPLANPWFNKNAFSIPGTYQLGNAARSYNELRAPNSYNESLGLMRRIAIKERLTLTLRGEFFNTFNRVVFGAPASNLSAANFGRVSSQANSPRQGLISARLDF